VRDGVQVGDVGAHAAVVGLEAAGWVDVGGTGLGAGGEVVDV
jgi:hypothetical protein